jgi:cytochrome c-type biogenesis protein
MGIVSSVFGSVLVGRMRYIEQAGGAVILLLGLLILFDVNIFKSMYRLSNIRVTTGGRFEGLVMGMALGVIWVPCIGPLLSSILAMVGTTGELAKGVFFLMFYSLGFSIPMLAVGYSSHFAQNRIRSLYGKEKFLRYVTGFILVAFGLYIIVNGNFAY